MKLLPLALAAATIAAPAIAADTLDYNSEPNDTYFFGGGNDYTPANAIVLTTGENDQLYLRLHQTYHTAPTSDASGVYSFALGTEPISFDWGFDNESNSDIGGEITVTNLLTSESYNYDPFGFGNDNQSLYNSTQNSFRVGGFNPASPLISFDANVDNTYRVDFTINGLEGGSRTVTGFAKLGAGAPAVPEPATWALLMLGFGMMGAMMRSRPKVAKTSVRYG